MGEFITASEGDFFVQTEISEPFEILTCVGVGDMPNPLGDLVTKYCPDPGSKGKFMATGQIRGEAGAGTTTLARPFSSVANWLLENDCEFNALVTWACAGVRAIPENYEIAGILFGAQPITPTLLAAVAMGPDEEGRVDTNVDISYLKLLLVYHLTAARQQVDNIADANGIAFLPYTCETRCAPARGLCEEGFIALDGTLYDSEVKATLNGGSLWEQTTTDPFEEGGDASDVETFETWAGERVIVSRGSSIAWLPAEISWTEDWGVTWHDTDVGTVNGQTIQELFKYQGRLYAAASGGDIYMSKDTGSTWTRVEHGTTAEDLADIVMYNLTTGYTVGDNNAFLYTFDGSEWNARAGPALATDLLSVTVNTKEHVFVGAADGVLYVSYDGGANWVVRRDFGVGSIDAVRFDTKYRYFGGLVHNTPAGLGTFYRSIDGGATWWAPAGQTGIWNDGITSIFVGDQNHFFLVGPAYDGNTFIAKVSPTG